MTQSPATIWFIILSLGFGTFLLRWSFLGALGNRRLPRWAERMLKYTAVTVLPALVAPLTVWPAATGGQLEPVRMTTAAATVAVGLVFRSTLYAILAGAAVLIIGFYWTA